ALAVWLALKFLGGPKRGLSAGEWLAHLAERLQGQDAVAPLRPAVMSLLGHQEEAPWPYGAVPHARRLVIMTAVWPAWMLRLIDHDYGFYWGSTLLTGEQVAPFVVWVGKPAAWLGLQVPDTSLIIATGEGAQWSAEAKFRWGTWLLWMVWLVGWLPRCLLF